MSSVDMLERRVNPPRSLELSWRRIYTLLAACYVLALIALTLLR